MSAEKSEPFALTLTEAVRLIRAGELSPVELTQSCVDRIALLDEQVRAFADFRPEAALAQARAAETALRGGDTAPLLGIPFAVKDQYALDDAPSFMHGGRAIATATAVRRLEDAGAILLGKLTMVGYPNRPPARNPWDLSRVAGGSSSGPAAAVAAQFCPLALGEDSAGSVRNPAALCGLVGLIGSYGRISRAGLAAMGWTIDHPGVLTWTVADAVAAFEVLAGFDPRDRTTSRRPVPPVQAALERDISGLAVGVPSAVIKSPQLGAHPDVLSCFSAAVDALSEQGATVVEIEIPLFAEATFVSFVLYIGEFSAAYAKQRQEILHNPLDARAGRLALGALTTAADYLHAQRLRARIRDGFRRALDGVDAIITPTMRTTAAPIRSDSGPLNLWWTSPAFTPVANVAGLPAISVPAGFGSDGLPIGVQVMARPFDEPTMIAVGAAIERTQVARRPTP